MQQGEVPVDEDSMELLATPEVRSKIRENGDLLFVRPSLASIRGAMRRVLTSTNLPEDALDYQRFETLERRRVRALEDPNR